MATPIVGARVVLDGSGGDQLFQVSDIYLADLFASGRWLEMLRQWRSRDGRGLRNLYRWAVKPVLPDFVVRAIARARGMGAPRHYLDRQPSAWCRHAFLREHGVLAQDLASRPALTRAHGCKPRAPSAPAHPRIYAPRLCHPVTRVALFIGASRWPGSRPGWTRGRGATRGPAAVGRAPGSRGVWRPRNDSARSDGRR